MTLKRFRALSRDVQYDVVKQFATFLLARKKLGLSVLLYQLNGFYVEVLFDTRTTSVKMIRSFESTDDLEPYLSMVNITEIYALLK
jgi:hypothetical protein